MSAKHLPVALSLVVALALSGCIRLGGKAPTPLFSLAPAALVPAGGGSSAAHDAVIAVAEPQADARIAVLRLAVAVSPTEVAYLKDGQWVERPSRQFQHVLAETLRASGRHVVIEGNAVAAGVRLGGRLIDLTYDAPTHRAVVRFEAERAQGNTVTTRRFEEVVANVPATGVAVAAALNDAANAVARDVAIWVG